MEADRGERRREARARSLPFPHPRAARPGGASVPLWALRRAAGPAERGARETPSCGWGRSRVEAPSRGTDF